MQAVTQGRVWSGSRAATIGLVDAVGGVAQAWELTGWPSAWRGPVLDAAEHGELRERLEVLAFDLIWLPG